MTVGGFDKSLTLDEVLEELQKIKAEEKARLDSLREWLRNATGDELEYSDIFKDVYGVRP